MDPEPEGLDDEDIKDALRPGTRDRGARAERERGSARRLAKREELRTWEACEKVVVKERNDFVEFVVSSLSLFSFIPPLPLAGSLLSLGPLPERGSGWGLREVVCEHRR